MEQRAKRTETQISKFSRITSDFNPQISAAQASDFAQKLSINHVQGQLTAANVTLLVLAIFKSLNKYQNDKNSTTPKHLPALINHYLGVALGGYINKQVTKSNQENNSLNNNDEY